jgi:hypothetical protein
LALIPVRLFRRPTLIDSHLAVTKACPIPVFAVAPAALAVLFSAAIAHPHAIGIDETMSATTVIEVFVEEEQIRVEIETAVPHLLLFNSVFPDQFRVRMGLESEPEGPRHERFFNDEFVIRADGGAPLHGSLVSFETRRRLPRDEITGEPFESADDKGEQVVFVVLRYTLDIHPRFLSFSPPPGARKYPSAKIGLAVYHLGLPVMDLSVFSGEETLDLDWDDPWNSTFRNSDLKRPQDSPLGLFLAIEPHEVRVEIIARAVDLESWTEIGVEDLDTIPVELQDEVRQRAAEFLADHLDLTIDGEVVAAALDRIAFLDRRIRRATVIDPPRDLGKSSATIGVAFVRPTVGYPREVALSWDLFPDSVDEIPVVVTDAAGARRFVMTRDDRVLAWKHEGGAPALPGPMKLRSPPSELMQVVMWASWLALAVAAVVLLRSGARAAGGAGSWRTVAMLALLTVGLIIGNRIATGYATVDTARASKIVSALLHNVYRAFDAPGREAVADTLERSIAGNLTDALLEAGRSLDLLSDSGGRATVEDVELVAMEMKDSEIGIEARCTWTVTTVTSRWGHSRHRVHRVVADLRIEPVDGVWKITGMDLAGRPRL